MTVNAITQLNIKWGICGFAASLAAMYSNNMIQGNVDTSVKKGHLNTRLLAEIKTYLNILKSENEIKILNEIQDYTRSFKGYGNFTIDAFIQKINSVAINPAGNLSKNFSIAMPPVAVLDYLKRIGGLANAHDIPVSWKQDNVILGLSKKNDSKLGHWVYKKNDSAVYNWGKKITVSELLKDFNIVYQISL